MARLGLSERVPPRIRVALRRWYGADFTGVTAKALMLVIGLTWPLVVARTSVNGYLHRQEIPTQGFKKVWTDLLEMDPVSFGLTALAMALQVIVFALLFTLILVLPSVALWRVMWGSSRLLYAPAEHVRRYVLVARVRAAVLACADAYGASGEKKLYALHRVGVEVGTVAHEVTVARRAWGSVPNGSDRHRLLKEHAGLVVAALFAAESRIDHDPDQAVKDLARMLVRIADRYAAGRLGALLDEEQLAGLTPIADREPLRLAVTAVVVAGIGVGVALLDLPGVAETYLIGGAGAAVVAILYGRRAHRGLDVLDAVRGIQRP
ncbi:hypothetical protein M5362_24495 [Streptomyces sp. Je 1-79]|uniref:hypothetical protein n=1 Tax=Streptomyces sp. Je 1-79 TaxID=2943847 RepID=UPI0021A2A7B4|nr:hypothetical protein [Streptomyces sp. Je 1-79]MCT4356292.1 hypothetical protein [Streptomyces sp. Je 1-79]